MLTSLFFFGISKWIFHSYPSTH